MLFLFMNLIFIYVMKKKTKKIDVDFIPLTLPSENVELGKLCTKESLQTKSQMGESLNAHYNAYRIWIEYIHSW